ncbi:MAG: hypothetical protein ACK5LL_11000 [Suipraeoptans sp.]
MKKNKDGRIILEGDDVEDVLDILDNVEDSLDIKFEDSELLNINSVDALINAILQKIELEDVDTCTSAQAFYKLRAAIRETQSFDIKQLTPNTRLCDLFPSSYRKEQVLGLEKHLGISSYLLGINPYLFVVLFIAFFVSLFFILASLNTWLGVAGLALSIIGFSVGDEYGKSLQYATVREFIEKQMVRSNYTKMRRDQNTVNKKEIRRMLENDFTEWLGVEHSDLKNIYFG